MAEIGQVRNSVPINWPAQNAIKPAEQQRRNPRDKQKQQDDASAYKDDDDNHSHIDEYA